MSKKNKDSPQRTANGQFAKGRSGNPAGRPKGSRNRTMLMAAELLEEETEEIMQVLTDLAVEGDPVALQLCVSRILPVCKEQPVHLDLPPPETRKGSMDALSTLIKAAGEGSITSSDAERLVRIIMLRMALEPTEKHDGISVDELVRRLNEGRARLAALVKQRQIEEAEERRCIRQTDEERRKAA